MVSKRTLDRAKKFASAFELIANSEYKGAMSEIVLDTLKWLDKEHTKLAKKIQKQEENSQENVDEDTK